MSALIQVIAFILSGFLVNKLSDRYEFPVPNWVLWVSLLGLGLLYELKDRLPQQLAASFNQTQTDQLGQWVFWGALGCVALAILAMMLWPRSKVQEREPAKIKTTSPAQDKAAADLQKNLLKVMSQSVATRRRESLHNYQLIDVRMADIPGAIGQSGSRTLAPKTSEIPERVEPQAIEMQSGWLKIRRMLSIFNRHDAGQELTPETSIVSVFQREEINRRLLILGEPGAGKSTYLLELAWELVQQAKDNSAAPVPVILDLASWQSGQSIADWIQAQLPKTIANLTPQMVAGWLEREALVLLLDGLDELGIAQQTACTRELKEWLHQHSTQPVVICCRKEEFDQMQRASGLDLAELQGAMTLLALEDAQIQEYLAKLERGYLWKQAIQPNLVLKELARRPFFLSILVEAYGQGNDRPIRSEAELLERYIQRRLEVIPWEPRHCRADYVPPNVVATRQYLSWLAQQIERNDQLFYIELMQPSLLENNCQRWIYRVIYVLFGGIISGFICGLLGGLIGGLIGLIYGFMGGLLVGLIGGLIIGGLMGKDSIELIEAFDVNFLRYARKKFLKDLIFWLIFWLILGLLVGVIYGQFLGLTFAVLVGLIRGLKQDIAFREYPNQGILASRNNVIVLFPIMTVAGTLIWWLISLWVLRQPRMWPEILVPGIGLGMFSSFLFGGGLAFFQHYGLRWVLASSSTPSVPWRYADFLSYSSDRRILQQVGGGYRFIHDKLRAHLAAHPTPMTEPNSDSAINRD